MAQASISTSRSRDRLDSTLPPPGVFCDGSKMCKYAVGGFRAQVFGFLFVVLNLEVVCRKSMFHSILRHLMNPTVVHVGFRGVLSFSFENFKWSLGFFFSWFFPLPFCYCRFFHSFLRFFDVLEQHINLGPGL